MARVPACILVAVALAAIASTNAAKLPTPAPAPSTNVASECISDLAALARDCPSYMAAVTSQAGSIPDNPTDAMVAEQVAKQAKPTAQCCTSLQAFLKPACYCDASVLRVLSGQNVDAVQMHTVMRAASLGCGYPGSSLRATC